MNKIKIITRHAIDIIFLTAKIKVLKVLALRHCKIDTQIDALIGETLTMIKLNIFCFIA